MTQSVAKLTRPVDHVTRPIHNPLNSQSPEHLRHTAKLHVSVCIPSLRFYYMAEVHHLKLEE